MEGSIRRLIQALVIYSAVTALVSLLHRSAVPAGAVLIPALWGAGALLPGSRGEFALPAPGPRPEPLTRAMGLYLLSSAVILPLYAAVFFGFRHLGLEVLAGAGATGTPVVRFAIYTIAGVAFFEELFFRSYLQSRFEEASRLLARGDALAFWIPVTASAFLFAAAHVAVDLDPVRIIVFFPGIWFGWLWAKTGSLAAPVAAHATANIVQELLARSVA